METLVIIRDTADADIMHVPPARRRPQKTPDRDILLPVLKAPYILDIRGAYARSEPRLPS